MPPERSERRRTVDERLENLVAVRHGTAVAADNHTSRRGTSLAGVTLDLAALRNGGRAVEAEGKVLVGGEREGERIGAEHVLDAKGRGDGRPGVCAGDADESLVTCHRRPIASDAVMGGVANRAAGHAERLGLLD